VFAYVWTLSLYAVVHCIAISTDSLRSASSDSKSMTSGCTASVFFELFRCRT
jgi:hypothetical protein